MQVTETKSEGLQRAYAAKATAAEIENKINAKIEEVRKDVQLPGFRKGKVPPALLKKKYGEGLHGEVVQEMVEGLLSDHLQETGHRPATQPEVKPSGDPYKPGDDLDIEISYEILPEIPEMDLPSIQLERMVVDVEDKAVDEALENLAQSAQDFETKDGAAEDGDQVVIDFVGKVDGEAFEGGAAEDFALGLGSGQFIPGFEDQLVGSAAGDEKAVEVTFPEEYGAAELAGKPAVFDVTVKEVKKPVPAAIDDALATRFGLDDLDALKGQIRERLAEEYKGAARSHMKRRLLDALNDKVTFDLPASMVDPEAKSIAHQIWHDENKDADPNDHSHGEIEPTEDQRQIAERRVRLGLVLADLGNRNEIEVTDAELNTAIMNQARQYPGQEKAFFDFVQKNPQMLQNLRAPIFEDKVVDFVFELISVSDRSVTADELKAELEKLEDE